MKIAFFSDVHANLPALEAMLRDMDLQQPDAVYCLGDLVGYHIWPNEVIAEIHKRKITTIAGNHDLKVMGLHTNPEDLQQPGKNYAYHIVKDMARDYLNTLPSYIKLEYRLNNEVLKLYLAHGSPRRVDEYVLVDTDQQYVLDMMNEAGADILFVGHSHKPYHRVVQTAEGHYKHVINTGSVGKPKDGDPRACYVLFTINENSSARYPNSIHVAFRRVAYDIEKAAKALEESLLPIELANSLRYAH